uniref:Uncharacterized protein n=1 Tax=Caenorhabditis japonica TaxID=281687 RepID=A0A8R1E7N5_CAEJA
MDDNDDDDDEWGDFDQARPSQDHIDNLCESEPNSARSEAARQLAHQQSIEEWGAFDNSTSVALSQDDNDEDGWQAEFSGAAPSVPVPSIPVVNLKMLKEMLDDDAFWDDGFSDGDHDNCFDNEITVTDIPTLFDLESLSEEAKSFDDEKRRYAQLWLSLRVVEEAISLKFDWKNSEIRKNHFDAIKIKANDAKKEIRSAANMFNTASLLLPTTPLQPSSSSTCTSSEDHHTSTQTSKTSSSSSPPSVESPSIPAADFDWADSGLTNPMNRANASSAIIDVDFLSTNGKATSYTSPLQKDLEQFGLALSNGAGSGAMTDRGPNIFDTLMSSTSSTAGRRSPYRSPEVLSLDAQKLLEQLPDLQYLQSGVLMFPVGTNLPH